MNNIDICVRLIVVGLLALVLNGCGLIEKNKDSAFRTALITADKKSHSISSAYSLLEASVQDVKSSDGFDNIIIFVHGRGKHPEKAFKKSLLADLESNYSAKVIMFNWGPSWKGPLGYPEDAAGAAAEDFKKVLRDFSQYKKQNGIEIDGIKMTLLTHSMGSIVIEKGFESKTLLPQVFDTIVISSSASAGKTHSKWVENIDVAKNIYITVNKADPILGKAGTKERDRRLGKGLENRKGDLFVLASNAHYIDVSEVDVKHRYYLHRDLRNGKSKFLRRLFDKVLNGIQAELNLENGVKEASRERIYTIKSS